MKTLSLTFFPIKSIALIIGSVFSPHGSFGQLEFDSPRTIAPNLVDVGRPFVADVDGNGALDVLLGSAGRGRIVSFALTENGIAEGRELIGGDVKKEFCHYADVNGDGFLDIITGRSDSYPADGHPTLYLNNGQGDFESPIVLSGGSAYNDWQVVTGDFTGDGIDEIVHLDGSNARVWRFINATHSLEQLASFGGDLDWKGAAVADINNDGISELLLAKWYWFGYWDPTLGGTSLTTIDEGTGLPWRLIPADINNDGRTDLITHSGNGDYAGDFTPYMQQADGSFIELPTVYLGQYVTDLKALDLNGVGTNELWGATSIGIMKFLLNADGSIASTDTVIHAQNLIERFLVQDIQSDGIPDILVATSEDELVAWKGSLGPAFTDPPQQLYTWPHDGVTSPVSLPTGTGGNDLAVVTGAFIYNSHPYGSSSDFTILSSDRNGLDPLIKLSLTSDPWFRAGDGYSIIRDDMDNDGDLDIIGSYRGGTITPQCMLFGIEKDQDQYAQHCFNLTLSPNNPASIRKIDTFDVDGDGYKDIHIKGMYNVSAQPTAYFPFELFLIRASAWDFANGTTPLPSSYYWNHADLDDDGLEELLVFEGQPGHLTVYRNLGQGQFEASPPLDIGSGSIGDPFADLDFDGYGDGISSSFVDMDSDGRLDLIRTSRGANKYVLEFQKITTTSIAEPVLVFEQTLGVNGGTYALPADFDHDGSMDLFVVDNPSSYVYTWTIFHSDGNFPFHDGILIYQGNTPYEPFLHDEDGDGDLDIVMRLGPCLYSMKNISPVQLVSTGSQVVYPNPTSGEFVVDLGTNNNDQLRVEVYDVTGRLALSFNETSSVFSVDLQAMRQGLYILRIWSTTTDKLFEEVRVILIPTD